METEIKKTPKVQSVLRVLAVLLITDLLLIGISLCVGWPSVDGTTLFFLGIAVLIIGYVLDSLLFGKYEFRGKSRRWGRYTYRSSSIETDELDQYQTEEGALKRAELENARRKSDLLLNISLAGVVAVILSFILPHLF